MKWFKHMTATWDDEKISALVSHARSPEYRIFLYGLWWRVLEIVASQVTPQSQVATVKYSIERWAQLLDMRGCNVRRCLTPLEKSGLVVFEWIGDEPSGEENTNLNTSELHAKYTRHTRDTHATHTRLTSEIRATIPNLLKYRDEYSQRSGQNRDSIGTKKEREKENIKTKTLPEVPALRAGTIESISPDGLGVPGTAAGGDPNSEDNAKLSSKTQTPKMAPAARPKGREDREAQPPGEKSVAGHQGSMTGVLIQGVRPSEMHQARIQAKNDLEEFWKFLNPDGLKFCLMPADQRAISSLIKFHPELFGPDRRFRQLLINRAKSHGAALNTVEPIHKWLRDITRYEKGPLNEFGSPVAVPRQY